MKCRKCRGKAIIKLYEHNLPLCKEHFLEFVEGRVQKAITDFRMVKRKERVLVVVSGGKDSLTLAFILKKLGYRISLLHIDLGIDEYSEISRKFCEEFANLYELPLQVISIKKEWGKGVKELARETYKSPCSLCGLVKRYYFNKFAYENGFSCVATGHNLDDMVSALMANLLGWRISYIAKQTPVLPEEGKLKRRIKPLVYLTEREIGAYAFLQGIPFSRQDCPYAHTASFLKIKHLLNQLEVSSPGTKYSFYLGFLKNKQLFGEGKVTLRECALCGFPTVTEICSFCKTFRKEEVRNYAGES